MRNTFKVYERLKKEQHITTLFHTGKAFSVFPLRVVYLLSERPAQAGPAAAMQAGFSVPKKKFRSSVHRHRVRRLMVEAWRTRKGRLLPAIPPGKQLHLFLLCTHHELPDFSQVCQAVDTIIEKLIILTSEAK